MDKRDLDASPRGPLEPTCVGTGNNALRGTCPRVQILNRGNEKSPITVLQLEAANDRRVNTGHVLTEGKGVAQRNQSQV